MATNGLQPAVFLDRDGVINRFPGEGQFVVSWDGFEFMPEVRPSLKRLRSAGYVLVLVTNQSGVGRGLMDLDDLHEIHEKMQAELGSEALDGIFYCPHHPDDGCDCRKPSTVMIQRAAEAHGIDLPKSFLVGDSGRDIEMGRAAGCTTILCRQNLPPSIGSMQKRYQPHAFARSLPEAVDWILDGMG